MTKYTKGFTLIEILVAATILAVLAAGGMAAYSSVNVKSRDSRRMSDIEQLRSALEMYRADHGGYPSLGSAYVYDTGMGAFNSTLNTDLVGNGYMQKLPRDPKMTLEYYYVSVGSSAGYNLEACTEASQPSSVCAGSLACTGLNKFCVKNP